MHNNELKQRRHAFIEGMKECSLALFHSGKAPYKSKDQNYPFTINRNFYYLTGLRRENFYLLLLLDGKNKHEYLFIEEPSDYATKWLGSRMTKEEASEISGIETSHILYLADFESFLAQRIMLDSRQAIGTVPKHLYLDLFRQFVMVKPQSLKAFKRVIETYPELKLKDATTILDDLRRVKSDSEIDEIRQAIHYTKVGIEALMTAAKPGVNERDLEAEFEYRIKQAGAKRLAFSTISASGKNATVLHYEENNCEILNHTLILNDLGAQSNEYAADITRTYPANGIFTERQKQFYQLVLDVNKTIIEMIKPGITVAELNEKATSMLAEGMIRLGKIKEASEITKYYYHSIGHYLGLDVHDVGTYTKPLEPGVVLTVEPGIYVGDEGIGIRIEDDVLVTKNGSENLSRDILKEIKDIEAFMKK